MQKHCNRDNNCEALESSPIEVEKPDQLIGVLSDVYLICGCNIWFIPDLPFKFQITLKGKSYFFFFILSHCNGLLNVPIINTKTFALRS